MYTENFTYYDVSDGTSSLDDDNIFFFGGTYHFQKKVENFCVPTNDTRNHIAYSMRIVTILRVSNTDDTKIADEKKPRELLLNKRKPKSHLLSERRGRICRCRSFLLSDIK